LTRMVRCLPPQELPAPPWRFGADPEFVFVHPETGRVIPASRFLPRMGAVGCDAQTVPGEPGHRPIGEVRPEPRRDPLSLVDECRRCLQEAGRRLPAGPLLWRAGSSAGEGLGL